MKFATQISPLLNSYSFIIKSHKQTPQKVFQRTGNRSPNFTFTYTFLHVPVKNAQFKFAYFYFSNVKVSYFVKLFAERPFDDRVHLQLVSQNWLHPRRLLSPERDVSGFSALLSSIRSGSLHLQTLLQAHPPSLGHQRLAFDPNNPKYGASNSGPVAVSKSDIF